MANLIGKDVLIVDEVDDTRTTLAYAVSELQKDVDEASKKLGREGEQTRFSIFVLHVSLFGQLMRQDKADKAQNKDKEKKASLPEELMKGNRYLAAETVGDEWINYPWEAT